ncbi:MAG TPA: hypothetical protein VLV89_02630 [Candidatus Acidoferrum sp.]|nr:hypothetical protein [Candidatus Acidoferrum sp.]
MPELSAILLQAATQGGDAPVILACVALAAAVLLFIFGTKPSPGDSAPHRSKLDQLFERRDTIYDNLRDLKFEYRAGKFGEKDYEETRLALETEAAEVLVEIEQATGSPSLTGRKATGHS